MQEKYDRHLRRTNGAEFLAQQRKQLGPQFEILSRLRSIKLHNMVASGQHRPF